ncbi:MAG: hypothetical protein IKR86_05410, partial [Candidatus Methanomethylophilaceae archaeon]|nr:hypothetical protein [Candidatus Methanomethylophilaceae archaeon]
MDKRILLVVGVAVIAIAAAAALLMTNQNGGGNEKAETISIVTNPDFAPYEYMVKDRYEGIDMDIWRA